MRNLILFFVVVLGMAAMSALTTWYFVSGTSESYHDVHDWLHEELNLTDDQVVALEKIEGQFADEESQLRDAFANANRDLATALREEGAYTPRVATAVEGVHREMGELQKLSIAHLFEMTTILEPEQSEKLMHYAEMALTEAH